MSGPRRPCPDEGPAELMMGRIEESGDGLRESGLYGGQDRGEDRGGIEITQMSGKAGSGMEAAACPKDRQVPSRREFQIRRPEVARGEGARGGASLGAGSLPVSSEWKGGAGCPLSMERAGAGLGPPASMFSGQ